MHLPSLSAAHQGAAPLSRALVAGEFRPRRLKLELEGQEAPAAACVAQATPCWELLEECSVSSRADVGGELITVSRMYTLCVLLEYLGCHPPSCSYQHLRSHTNTVVRSDNHAAAPPTPTFMCHLRTFNLISERSHTHTVTHIHIHALMHGHTQSHTHYVFRHMRHPLHADTHTATTIPRFTPKCTAHVLCCTCDLATILHP